MRGSTGLSSVPGEVRVLGIDDHRVFSELLALALDATPDLRAVNWAISVRDGLAKAAAHAVDVVVVDVQLPDGNGIDAVGELRRIRPEARIIVLTGHPRQDLCDAALAAGAAGFLAKDAPLDVLLSAIREATPQHPHTPSRTEWPAVPALTGRELDVLRALARGLSSTEIAEDLVLSPHTVRDHVKAVRTKLGARSQVDAVSRGIAAGLVEPRWP